MQVTGIGSYGGNDIAEAQTFVNIPSAVSSSRASHSRKRYLPRILVIRAQQKVEENDNERTGQIPYLFRPFCSTSSNEVLSKDPPIAMPE